jgi:long-chain fatty acid transport protein
VIKALRAAALVFGVLGGVTDARAAGLATARFGGEHGNVTEGNPTALYFNPGAIAASHGLHLYADGVLAVRRLTWTHPAAPSEAPDPPGAAGSNSGRAEALNVFGAPMLGATLRLGNFALGAAVYVPFGGRVSFQKNDRFVASAFPLAADGVQRWHVIKGAVTNVYGSFGLAYQWGPLSLGATANLIASSISDSRAKNPNGQGDPDTTREGRVTTDVKGVYGSFGVGALFEAVEDKLWFGASYQAQPGLGPMRLKGTITIDYQGSGAPFPATLDQALPDIIRAGARFRPLPSLELRLFGDYTRWSVLKTMCAAVDGHPCLVDSTGADAGNGGVLFNLRRNWRDTYGVRVGASHWLSKSLEGFVGAGFETAAAPDATLEPETADSQSLAGAVGARVELPAKWFVGGSFTYLYFFNRDNTGNSQLTQALLPTRGPDGGGVYTQWISILNANVEKEF